jgi:uncharacterized protein YecT (DUF1311 family)
MPVWNREIALAALTGTLVLSPLVGSGAFDREPSCDMALPEAELTRCLSRDLREADKNLNQAYRNLLSKVTPEERKSFILAQRDWIKRRDSTCSLTSKESNREQWFRSFERDRTKTVCVIRLSKDWTGFLKAIADSKSGDQEGKQDKAATEAAPAWTRQHGDYEVLSSRSYTRGKYYLEATILRNSIAQLGDADVYVGIVELLGDLGMGSIIHARKSEPFTITQIAPGEIRFSDADEVTVGIAVDLDEGKLYVRQDGQWLGAEPGSAKGTDIKLGRSYRAKVNASVPLGPLIRAGLIKVNFGQVPFRHEIPKDHVSFEIPASTAAGTPESTDFETFVVPPRSSVAETSLPEWTTGFWRRLKAIPEKSSPAMDTTGARCSMNQSGPVWFLAGSFDGGRVSRICRIPEGKYVLVTLLSGLVNPSAGSTASCAKLKDTMSVYMDGVSKMRASLDGNELQGLSRHRHGSPDCFYFEDAEGKRTGPAYSEGYWIMLKPLPRGNHVLRYGATADADGFSQDIIYTLVVE